MIAYYTPPLGMSGGMRVTKFAKYLPQFGWQPVILTVKPIAYYHYDYELLSDLKNVRIYRSESLDPNRLLYLSGHRRPKYTQRRGKLFLSLNHLLFPDAKLLWAPFAYSLGKKIIRAESPDLIFATAPPYTSLLLGLLLKKYSGLPLVCDFRDLWPAADIPPSLFQKPWVSRFRRRILKESAAAVAINRRIKELLGNSCVLIENGYDPEDFKGRALSYKKFHIVYTGHIQGRETGLTTFLEAIKGLSVKFSIAGVLNVELTKIIKSCKNVEYIGPLPHSQATRLMKSADLLLYLARPEEVTSSTIFEYLGARQPILVIALQPAESSELVERHRAGISVRPIKDEIKKAVVGFTKKESPCDFVNLDQFSRIHHAQRLAQLFDPAAS